MKNFSREYIRFERKHLKYLEELWYKTQNEELRKVILEAREILEKLFENREEWRKG